MADEEFIKVLTYEDQQVVCIDGDDVTVQQIIEEQKQVTLEETEPSVVVVDSDFKEVALGDDNIVVVQGDLGDNVQLQSTVGDATVVQLEEVEHAQVQLAEVFIGSGGAGGAALPKITTAVPVGQTVVCDSIPVELVEGVKWIVALIDPAFLRVTFEVNATWRAFTTSHTVYAKAGDEIPHEVGVAIDVGDNNIEISITNNHTLDLVAKVLRLAN